MKAEFEFTFAKLEAQYRQALDAGYAFLTCEQYAREKDLLPPLTVVNRVDIDFSAKKAHRLRDIYDRLGIKASFFVRLHAPEYNPFSFENYRVLKAIRDSGHEIGYHSEIVDQSAIWNEDASACLRRDIDILNRMLDIDIQGVASHGGMTGLNNLDFWKNHTPDEFGLKYEAYDNGERFNLFNRSLYVSDSEWTRWKCYENGILRDGDRRSFGEHVTERPPLIYLLIHSDTYFDKHFYE
ncbi:hypothetical protein G5B88_21330 [Herbaspirillum seropedicae]|uniref:Polysaccharide deacetylase n=1 Tax=Herbaspirillum seropedicae (strain SmR1) TaxID=757424 RepID=D8IUE2_HERSS|nr:hypothetical protein [Herbaspirillum seropedicae]ADJ65674.1 conserved hypothetical protein [Herbaspirillum seropedicae SmR1]AKN67489.1 hypothetical protein ACP92_21005 [Herbaspirillum seropedicae]NQE32078.1 hypothetical protein [Herbaspirillum seropedicae]UMU23497.1 hypothetical protein G5B88_21330 [Herbaspirillum seropedicae]